MHRITRNYQRVGDTSHIASKYSSIRDSYDLCTELLVNYSRAMTEAQLWESDLSLIISRDFSEFYKDEKEKRWVEREVIDYLSDRTIGQLVNITTEPNGRKENIISKCLGIKHLIKLMWDNSNPEFESHLKDLSDKRNYLAHSLLADVLNENTTQVNAVMYCIDCIRHFQDMHNFFITIDALSADMGSIMPNGEVRQRFGPNPTMINDDMRQL